MQVGHRVGVVVGPPWMGWTPLPVPVLFVGLPAPPPRRELKNSPSASSTFCLVAEDIASLDGISAGLYFVLTHFKEKEHLKNKILSTAFITKKFKSCDLTHILFLNAPHTEVLSTQMSRWSAWLIPSRVLARASASRMLMWRLSPYGHAPPRISNSPDSQTITPPHPWSEASI